MCTTDLKMLLKYRKNILFFPVMDCNCWYPVHYIIIHYIISTIWYSLTTRPAMLHAEKEIRTTLKCISLECYSFSNFASVETERGYTSLPLSSILPFASQKRHQKEARDEESRWKSQRNTTVLSRCIQVESVFTVKKSQTHLSGLHISQCKPQRKKSYRMCCNVVHSAQSIQKHQKYLYSSFHSSSQIIKALCVLWGCDVWRPYHTKCHTHTFGLISEIECAAH